MPSEISFCSELGISVIDSIVKKRVTSWSEGLRPFQLTCIPKILDCEDLFAIEKTGGGKSALFGIPILVHHEISENPTLYPKFSVNIRQKAVGIVVTPTKGLANDIVKQLRIQLGIEGFAYTHENLTTQRKSSINIVKEISSCRYSIICVDPEHLREREWYLITNSSFFRANVIFACAEEGHVINEWGHSFRPLFRHIGMFFRGRLPSHISVFSLTATMQPGEPLHSVCDSLGFAGSRFHLIRQSNERTNHKIIVEPLTSAIGGSEFPQLITYLNQRRKTIIHVRTIDLGYRIFLYLFKHSPKDSHRLRRFRMYNSLVSDDYNEKTISLLDSDPFCQVAIATKALSLGVHAKAVTDSVSVGGSDTQDESEQSGGRAGRDESVLARRIILATPSELLKADKIAKCLWISSYISASTDSDKAAGEVSISAIMKLRSSEQISSKSKKTPPIDPAKVVYYTETFCRVACGNRIYANPPAETSHLDCIQAERRAPCDLCCSRYHIPDDPRQFPPYADEAILPRLLLPPTTTKPKARRNLKTDDMRKKEMAIVKEALVVYESDVYREECLRGPHRNRPRSFYFPKAISDRLATDLLKIKSPEQLKIILESFSWPFVISQGLTLFMLIQSIQSDIRLSRHKTATKTAARKSKKATSSDEPSEISDIEPISPPRSKRSRTRTKPSGAATISEPDSLESSDSDSICRPSKRPALKSTENQPRVPRQPQQTYAQAQSFYSKPSKSYRSTATTENTQVQDNLRRSSRFQK